MSRSIKKPYQGYVGSGRKAMKRWKDEANQKIRNSDEVLKGSYYKKIFNQWTRPDDGKCFREDDPKACRK